MTNFELMNRIVEVHNRIVRVSVSGENTILIADTIKDLRGLLAELQAGTEQGEPGHEGVSV